MFKTAVKFTLVFVLTAALAAGAASVSYIITRNLIEGDKNSKTQEKLSDADTVNVMAEESKPQIESTKLDYYIVRLEGEALGVYASFGGREEFLYNKDVYKANLSQSDIELLSSGVKLNSPSELTGFMENYTS